MRRWIFPAVALLSALGVAFVAACMIRGHYSVDHFRVYRWQPSSRTYTEYFVRLGEGGGSFHSEATTALASDDASAVAANAGPSNLRIAHDEWSAGPSSGGPFLWGDHYHPTPSVGINTRGVSDCWTLEFRYEVFLFPLAIPPAIWAIARFRRNRRSAARGFSVITNAAAL